MKVDGTIDKLKARLVIQGFRQKEGIDYFDTYAPVARITTTRLLLALAAIHNLVIYQIDVKTAFLNGGLEEKVYMKQLIRFCYAIIEHKGVSWLSLVWRSKKSRVEGGGGGGLKGVGLGWGGGVSIEKDPRTYNEAMKSRDVTFSKEAIDDEISSIMENNTWVLSDLPPGCKPLGCK
ncbi:zinc finger, CCHC-type containing protein [Tanacetum coccineum]